MQIPPRAVDAAAVGWVTLRRIRAGRGGEVLAAGHGGVPVSLRLALAPLPTANPAVVAHRWSGRRERTAAPAPSARCGQGQGWTRAAPRSGRAHAHARRLDSLCRGSTVAAAQRTPPIPTPGPPAPNSPPSSSSAASPTTASKAKGVPSPRSWHRLIDAPRTASGGQRGPHTTRRQGLVSGPSMGGVPPIAGAPPPPGDKSQIPSPKWAPATTRNGGGG